MGIIETFKAGGSVMYILLICSICVASIMIERIMFYKRAGKNIDAFVSKLPEIMQGKDFNDLLLEVKEENNIAAMIVEEGIQAAIKGQNTTVAIDTAYSVGAESLRARLSYLSMIVTLAPLLGLLGTIAGMISSFNVFSLQAGQPLAITGGIGEALIPTATGLCVAIFALVVHTWFAAQVDHLLTVMERACSHVEAEIKQRGL